MAIDCTKLNILRRELKDIKERTMWMRTLLLIEVLLICQSVSAKEWLIDVRTTEEFSVEHVPGARNIEYQRIVPEVSKLGISKKEPIQLYCRSGRRAEAARQALLQNGYQQVINLGSFAAAEASVLGRAH
jgi:phage shock protein E